MATSLTSSALDHLALNDLIAGCRHEIHMFQHRQRLSEQHCFELFRRAIVHGDDGAWSAVYELYSVLVRAWVSSAKEGKEGWMYEEDESLVNKSFAKFAHSLSADKFVRFPSVPALLAYLKCCARSVAFDAYRYRAIHHQEIALEAVEREPLLDDPAEAVIDHLFASQLWETLSRRMKNEKERVVIQALYMEIKPRDLVTQRPDLFRDIKSVHCTRRNVLERLRRDHDLFALATDQRIA